MGHEKRDISKAEHLVEFPSFACLKALNDKSDRSREENLTEQKQASSNCCHGFGVIVKILKLVRMAHIL